MAAGQRLVAYERVSTARQGASGLGLEAQRKVIEDFAASRGTEVLARFTEVESGRKADRSELAKALHLAKVTGATLVIAKLDRLSRNAAFLLALRDSGAVRGRGHARGERRDCGDHGTGRPGRAGGDLPEDQGGAGSGQGTRDEAGEP